MEFVAAVALVMAVAVVVGTTVGAVYVGVTYWAEKARSPMGQAARTMALVLAGACVMVGEVLWMVKG